MEETVECFREAWPLYPIRDMKWLSVLRGGGKEGGRRGKEGERRGKGGGKEGGGKGGGEGWGKEGKRIEDGKRRGKEGERRGRKGWEKKEEGVNGKRVILFILPDLQIQQRNYPRRSWLQQEAVV